MEVRFFGVLGMGGGYFFVEGRIKEGGLILGM